MTKIQDGPFLVTGASGQLGARAVELLQEVGVGPLIVTTRSVEKLAPLAEKGVSVRAADFKEPAGLAQAFAGAQRMLLISTNDLTPGARMAAHDAAIKAAKEAGVKHIVYTSLTDPGSDSPITFAIDHRETEAALVASGIPHTILRNNLYSDNFLMSLPQAIQSGQLLAAAGKGTAGYVTREDCARAAVAALLHEAGTKSYDISGPTLVGHAELAGILSEIVGKPITYVPIPVEDLRAGMIAHGLPEVMAATLASFDTAIAVGNLAVISTAVQDLTGRAPTSAADFLRANKAVLLG
jgi:NAD(P)H dehydrogenase (quinone)